MMATAIWVLVLGTSSLIAQPPTSNHRPPSPEDRMEALHLSETQKARVQEIREKYRLTFEQMRQGSIDNREDFRQSMEAMRSELRSILTPEQQQQWEAQPSARRMPIRQHQIPERNQVPPYAQRPGRSLAAPVPPRHRPPTEVREAHAAIQEYSEKNILPVLKHERKALEAKITPADRQLLASMRTQAKAHGLLPGGVTPHPARQRRPAIGKGKNHPLPPNADMEKLVKRYGKDIEKIFAKLEPQVDKWNSEMGAIQEKQVPASKGVRPEPKPPRPAAYHWLNPAQFLLLSPE